MPATIPRQETFRITATAASPTVSLAIGSVAALLGIDAQQAACRLASLPSVLADQVPGPKARQMSAMLALLGLRVRLDPEPARITRAQGTLAISLLPVAGADRLRLARQLESVLGPMPDLPARLALPGGVILRDRSPEACDELRKALRPLTGLRIAVSDPGTAEFDLLAPPGLALCSTIAQLGIGPCPLSGAVAGGLNLATGRVLLQVAAPDAILLDRAFQRFDLLLQAVPRHAPAGVAGFLATRPGAGPVTTLDRRHLPLRIDTDLPRGAAEQFIADYAVIGLDVSARLRGNLSFEPRENP